MTQNNLITIVTMWNKVNELSRENLFQRHEKQPKKNPAETTGNRYEIGVLCVGCREGRDCLLLRSD